MEITVKKPTSILKKPISIKPKFFVEALSGVLKLTKGDISEGIEKIANSLFETEVFNDPTELAWILVHNSVKKAVYKLAFELLNEENVENVVFDVFEEKITDLLSSSDLELNSDFFDKPQESKFIENVKSIFKEFLETLTSNEADINNILNRFPRYYVNELSKEWNRDKGKYIKILSATEPTPFENAQKIENAWFLYNEYLRMQVEKPMFDETFSTKDIYVGLRAYYVDKKDNDLDGLKSEKIEKRVIVYVEDEVNSWIKSSDNKDDLKIISGGPGFGKSTTLKILASRLTYENDYKVLYIPLHLYNLSDDFQTSVTNFLKHDPYLKVVNLFEEEKLLLIFDGLDELAMRGKTLEVIAKDFIADLKRELHMVNRDRIKIKAIVSGRDIIIQNNSSEFRKEKEVLNLLPFYVKHEKEKSIGKIKYIDSDKLLNLDQREIWWEKFGELKNKDYNGIPKQLKKKSLEDITSFPLLNYLMALSYERKVINFDENVNINSVYSDLLRAVYERNWSSQGVHKAVEAVEYEEFISVFEEIALSIWKDNGRKTSLKDLKNQCRTNKALDKFLCENGKGLISLLVAFYFRKAGNNDDGDDVFEFTHKTFGEFLTGKRIVKELEKFSKQLRGYYEDPDMGKSPKDLSISWLELFGHKELDHSILNFIKNEFMFSSKDRLSELKTLQKNIVDIFNYVLKNGFEIETKKFNEANKIVINAEKSFFYILGSIARFTHDISKLKWTSNTQFGEIHSRLIGQRVTPKLLINEHLNHLDISNSQLNMRDFFEGDLSYSILDNCTIAHANFMNCMFLSTSVKKSEIFFSNFEKTVMSKADFKGTNFWYSKFCNAKLFGINFSEVNFDGSDLNNATIKKSEFVETEFINTQFKHVDLEEVNFTEAGFNNVNTGYTLFKDSNLSKVTVKNTKIKIDKDKYFNQP